MHWDWEFSIQILPQLWEGVKVTVQATTLGTMIAMTLGLLLAIARRSVSVWISRPVGFFVEFIRGTPLLVQLYFLFYILPDLGLLLSPLTAGVVGLGLHYSTYTAEVYRAGIDAIPSGQGGIWADDSQIAELHVLRLYGFEHKGSVQIKISECRKENVRKR